MNNQAFSKIWIIVILIILVAGGILLWQYWQKGHQETLLEEETLVKEVVILFGQRIKNVGGKKVTVEVIREDIKKEYSDLLSKELYSKWIQDPTNALVKIQGGPWPDRIEITSLTKVEPAEYQVKGLLIWKSSIDEGIDGLELRVIQEKDEVLERERWAIDNINFFALPIEEIANWKTYKNEKYKFEVKSPNVLTVYEEEIDDGFRATFFQPPVGEYSYVTCLPVIRVINKNLEEYEKSLKTPRPGVTIHSKREISIKNYKGIEVRSSEYEMGVTNISVLLPHNSILYSISSCEDDEEFFNQFLSTFRFLE